MGYGKEIIRYFNFVYRAPFIRPFSPEAIPLIMPDLRCTEIDSKLLLSFIKQKWWDYN